MAVDGEVEALKRAISDALRDERWAEALPFVETWCSRFPDRASGWLNLGYCLVRLGRFPEAVAAFDRCLVLDPHAAKARGWREHALAGMAAAAPPAARGAGSLASGVQPAPAAGGGEPFAEPAPAAPTHATIAIPDASRGWPVGTVVDGRYEVREVARGGMAVVAIAFDRELRRMVAIKTPLPSALASAEGRARFQREAESWIAFGLHPNICCAYYLQEIGGMPRLFVEHVDGGDLGQWLKREDPPRLDERLDIAIQIAAGLDYTHSFVWTDDEGVEHRGVVHRDVKPANILLGSDGVARVTDFGLVRVADGVEEREAPARDAAPLPAAGNAEDSLASGSWQTVTIEGGLVGTPPYMAPELWRKAQRGTTASDIYAYGCMLYEIFCGRRPLLQAGDTGSQTREENLVGWMRLHLRGEPPDPQALRPDLPGNLAALMRSCLAKRPADRPQSFAKLRDELAAIYAEAVGRPYPRPWPKRTQLLADSLANRGVSFITLDQPERAAASFAEALAVDPHHLEATCNAALLEWRREGLTDAELERRLSEAERGAADPVRCALLRARLRLLLDDPAGAEAALRDRVVGSDAPADVPFAVRRELGLAVLARARAGGRPEAAAEARELLAATVAESPSDVAAVIGLAEACALGGDQASADRAMAHARDLEPAVPAELAAAAAAFLPGKAVDRSLPLAVPLQSLLPVGDGELAVRGADGTVLLWNGVDQRPERRFAIGGPARQGRSMTLAGGQLVACLENGPLTVFDLGRCERLRSLRPHPGVASCVAASPDGRVVASGGSDRCLRLWSLETGECERTLGGHGAFVASLAWEPAGRRIVTASADGTLRVWDLGQGRCAQVLEGHRGPVRSLALSADGRRGLSAGQDGTVGVWDLESGAHLRWLRGHRGAVTAVAVAGEVVAAGGEDGTLRLWELASGRSLRVHRMANPIQDLAPAADGGLWVGHGSTVSRLRLPALRPLPLPLVLAEAVMPPELAARESDFRRHLEEAEAALGGARMTDAIAALRRARQVPGYEHHGEALALWGRVLAFYPKGAPRRMVEVRRVAGGPGGALACCVLEGGGVVVAGADGCLRRVETAHGGETAAIAVEEAGTTVLAVRSDGRVIAAGGRDGAIRLWDVNAPAPHARLAGHGGGITALGFTHGGELVSAADDGTILFWPAADGALPEQVAASGEATLALAASDDGRFLASAGWDSQVTIWDLERRVELRRLEGHVGPIHALAFSPDCRVVASAGEDGTIRLWEPLGGRCLRVLGGHEGAVRRVAFTPDARFVLSAGKDATLKLWDARTGVAALSVGGHAGPITDLALDPGGAAAVSTGADASVRLWFIDWEPEPPEGGGWDDRVRPFLEVFLRRLEKAAPGGSAPSWSASELAALHEELGRRGFGWLAPERIGRELETMASTRDEGRGEERQQARELAERRQRERRAAPARRAVEFLTRNLGLKLVGLFALVILGVLAVASLRAPDEDTAALNQAFKAGVASLARERGQNLRRGAALAYQEGPTLSQVPCAADDLPFHIDLALNAERRFEPPLDPTQAAADSAFRTRYADALACSARVGGAAVVEPVLARAAAQLHPLRLEDLASILVRIGAPAEPRLRQALDDHAEEARHLAAVALLHGGRDSGTEALRQALAGDRVREVEAASSVLTELVALDVVPEPAAFETVRRLCRSIDPRVRRNAVRALVLFEPGGPSRRLLDELLEDSDPEVVLAAERTRGLIRDAKIEQLFGGE